MAKCKSCKKTFRDSVEFEQHSCVADLNKFSADQLLAAYNARKSATIFEINEHKIDVSIAGMEVDNKSQGPGAYDCIRYRGFEICTFEEPYGKTVEGLYVGPFYVSNAAADFETDSLAGAVAGIAKLIGEVA